MDEQFANRLQTALGAAYRIERELGGGGMSRVFVAEEVALGRRVVVKVLPPEMSAGVNADRFSREIRLAASLQHPHIVPLHSAGHTDDLVWYTMPLIEGQSLREKLAREGELPVSDAVRILRDVADALAYAHAHGVVHRDIKPDNVMLSGRHALVTDFGVAKAVSEAGGTARLTTVGVSIGTPAYMAPEQATADPNVDHRADIYALGVLGYEMLTGHVPFEAPTAQAVLAAHVTQRPRPLLEARSDLPPRLSTIVMRCLEKNPDDRFPSADELLTELEALATPGSGVTPATAARAWRPLRRPGRAASAAAVIVLAAVAWLVTGVRHSARVHWAREQALPQIRQLADSGRYAAAYDLALQANALIPADSQLTLQWLRFTRRPNIRTDPPGARVFLREYLSDSSAWRYVGTTPLDSVRIPLGGLRFRFEKAGYHPLEVAGVVTDSAYTLDDGRALPAGMVHVPGARGLELDLAGLEQFGPFVVSTYLMDAYEVTNRQYKAFVDSGGYRRPELWDQPFVEGGRALTRAAALARFVDRTGRPGPATWEAGDYPAGQADYPVSGLSWYEAAAYAKFAGKSLPTIYHWVRAAGTYLASWVVPRSNLGGSGPARVGSFSGVGPFGTYDMAGNVREWCLNATGQERYILGGGWNDPTYAFNDPQAQPPFDRSATNGIRLVRYLPGDTTLAATSRPAELALRDFSKERPVQDAIYQVYRRMYDYDRTPLRAKVDETDSSAEDWVRQRVSFDAAYGNERVIAYLYLPKHGRPPYQTVVYFPGSGALNLRRFLTPSQAPGFDFILKSGRAVMFPVYKSTYERGDGFETDIADESSAYRDHVIIWVKDLRRSIDYLELRAEIDTSRLAYYGFSWGGYLGGLMPAVEPRLRVVLLYVAGLENQRGRPEVEPINFLPRIRVPVLMLNGRYDPYFPVESSQRPFFRLLGTPPQHKRQVISEGGHYVPRTQLIAEILSWLDRYLGSVH